MHAWKYLILHNYFANKKCTGHFPFVDEGLAVKTGIWG
jgi:hypothetical protein